MRPLDTLATISAWSAFSATLIAFDPVLRLARLGGEARMDRAVSAMARVLSWSVPAGLCRLQVDGLEHAPRGGRLIIVANHQSLVENFLPLWVLDHLRPRYVAKRSMGRWIPSVSYNLRAGGHCLIDRSSREQALEQIAGLGRRVHAGEVSALIFPEGTRSGSGRINRLKTSGLSVLLEAAPRAALLPVVFYGGDRIYPRGRPRVQAGARVRMRVLPPLARDLAGDAELIEEVAERLQAGFAALEREERGG